MTPEAAQAVEQLLTKLRQNGVRSFKGTLHVGTETVWDLAIEFERPQPNQQRRYESE